MSPLSLTIGTNREENFSTKCASSLEASRLRASHVDQGRPASNRQPSASGTLEAIRLIQPLRSRASFAQLSKHGRRRQGRWCWVRFAPPTTGTAADTQSVPHVGYAIGRKVGNAVVRNRIRRRLRPIMAAEAESLAPGYYLIGVRTAKAAWISHEELRNDLRSSLSAASAP